MMMLDENKTIIGLKFNITEQVTITILKDENKTIIGLKWSIMF